MMASFIAILNITKDNVSETFKENDALQNEFKVIDSPLGNIWVHKSHDFIHEKQQIFHAQIDHIYQPNVSNVAALYDFLGPDPGNPKYTQLDGLLHFVWLTKDKAIFYVDHLSSKPLYYFQNNHALWISDELKIIVDLIPYKKVNEDYLDSLIKLDIPSFKFTPFEGVFKIPPRHILKYIDRQVKFDEYWSIDDIINKRPKNNLKAQDLLETLSNRLYDRIKHDNSVGSQWSGGMDSSLLASILGNHDAVSYYHHQSDYDLTPVIEALKINHIQTIGLLKGSLIKQLYEFIRTYKYPVYSQLSFLSYEMFEIGKQQKQKTLISGFGGDEMVSANIKHEIPWLIKRGAYRLALKACLKIFPGIRGVKIYLSYLLNLRNDQQVFTQSLPIAAGYNLKEDQTIKPLHRFDRDATYARVEMEQLMSRRYGIRHHYPYLDKQVILKYFQVPDTIKYYPIRPRNFMRKLFELKGIQHIEKLAPKEMLTVPAFHRWYKDNDQEIMDYMNSLTEDHLARKFLDIDALINTHNQFIQGRFDKNCNPGFMLHYISICILLEEFSKA